MGQKAEDEKAEKTKRDGAKLSFQEKMKLFAVEAGEKTPNRDKAKISRAQRDLEDDGSGNEEFEEDLKPKINKTYITIAINATSNLQCIARFINVTCTFFYHFNEVVKWPI